MAEKLNPAERVKMVKAMEYIARQINDENIFYSWLSVGVADGDIDYGDLSYAPDEDDIALDYIDDNDFRDLMSLFLRLMRRAGKSGGLYCNGIVADSNN